MTTAGQRVGRFVLRDVLGRGAQATVWRARDERLDRDVALKLLAPGADAVSVDHWLHEARAVGRLNHPNIVPVYDADTAEGRAWLVFELVRGPTLSERLRRDGALPVREAVTLAIDMLDALAAAHAQGLVHRDLKPSNILLDAGRARVMDFGIAARVDEVGDGRIVGTPGYMSPEAARGLPPQATMDLFAVGLLLGEMLSGQRLLVERDSWRAVQRVQDEDLTLPADVAVDDRLRSIVLRALSREAQQRWPTAVAMRDALAQWLQPAAAAVDAAAGHGTLEFLLRRMRHKSDFPALSDAMSRIQRVTQGDHHHLNALAEAILEDVALTHKLLRLVNSAGFSHAGGGTISTVSRAVALVGFANVRNMAMSLVLLEHMQDKTHAARLREEFLRSLAAGQIAGALAMTQRDGEEAYLGAMLTNLGRLLVEFYFPDEARDIRALVQGSSLARGAREPVSVQAAAQQVLGISLAELGQAVARSWGLPDTLVSAMQPPPAGALADRGTPPPAERVRWQLQLANDTADAVLTAPGEQLPPALAALARRYAPLGVEAAQLGDAVQTMRQRLRELVQAVGLQVRADAPAQRLLADTDADATVRIEQTPAAQASPAEVATLVEPPRDADRCVELLNAGIQDVTHTLAGDNVRLNDVLRMILETMFRSLGFRRVVFGLRDPRSQALKGRFGLGPGADLVAQAMSVPLQVQATSAAPPDLFTAVCLKGADTLIVDAAAPAIAARLPLWWRERSAAPAFLVLPMAMKGATFALIYAEWDGAGRQRVGERELGLLRTLRNQAIMAFKQVA